MTGRRLVVPLLFVLAVVAVGAGLGSASGDGGIAATPDDVAADRIVIEVALHADGSASWVIQHRVELDSPGTERGFEHVQETLAENRSQFRDPFARRVRAMATEAEEATGRVMVVQNVSVDARRDPVQPRYGVIEYSFRWYGFAATDERLRAGDALSGLFLDEKTKLLVTWPENTTLADVTPAPDQRRERAVVWEGPVDFVEGEPRVTLESSGSFGPDLAVTAGSDDVILTLGTFGLLVVGLGTTVTVWRRRRATDADQSAADGEQRAETADEETESVEPATPTTSDGTADDAGDTSTAAESPETGDSPPDVTDEPTEAGETAAPPEELLSNEERVLALLDERGGRMKQQEIVAELDWSETKTSEVVSDLREADDIEVYRLGRENVLALPDTGLGLDTGGDEE